jgi:predicted enzyme related to lactoylglutathione lyase
MECAGKAKRRRRFRAVATFIPLRSAYGRDLLLTRRSDLLSMVTGASMDLPPSHLNLVVLRSADIERAVTFYRKLGLQFSRHKHGSGPEHYTSEVNGLVFELYPVTPKSSSTTGTRIGFRVDSVDSVCERLSQISAIMVTPPADSEWGRRAVVKDFDGHVVELLAPNCR